jgi:hypothetical protein
MKTISTLLLVLLCCMHASAQNTRDYAVEITATVQSSPAQIALTWRSIPNVTSYKLYRKTKNATAWGSAVATVAAPATSYADAGVAADSAYEYKVEGNASNFTAYGYIYAGINLPETHNKGTLVMIVDSTFTDSCHAELYQLMKDYSGDGWQIVRHDVARTLRDSLVREMIKNDYVSYPNVRAVQLIGHVAVPYSGYTAPDGHPDHVGAWPADVYYGNMTGTWTDATVNVTTSPYPANVNVPGDGKWDQTSQTTPNELQVSRIDFYNMPAFNKTEVQMMRSYLNKDHSYKMDSLTMNHRGLISDNFGAFGGEAFAGSGWRNFSPLVNRDSVTATSTLINDMSGSNSYQWAYGCGGGWFTGASGIGSTSDYVTHNVNGIFMMLFGSYFGDWNSQDNFLRAPLCSDVPALTNCWAGRPHWYFHHMALGENIGYDARLSQNNFSLYVPGYYGSVIYIALMGDLSLRTDYINPPQNVTITAARTGPVISWTASADPGVTGYYVYRSDSEFGTYTLVSGKLTTTSFTDTYGANGFKYYMVRATKPETTPSGTYNNLSIGVTAGANVVYPAPPAPKGVLVVTEVSNGPSGDCEYVVMAVANCTANNTADTVNIQGWILDDNAGNFNAARTCQAGVGISQGHYRLAYDKMWSKVAVGSVIVLYNRDATCYNLPATINGPDANDVYWQPVGGTVASPYYNPHIERYDAAPGSSVCAYCNAGGPTLYAGAASWVSTVGLDDNGDAFQVRCPGCTGNNLANEEKRPTATFYHGFGYGSDRISNPFQSIPVSTGNLGGPVINLSSGAGRKFYFTGLTGADLGDPAQWTYDYATTADPIGILRNGFMKRIREHMLSLPCCASRLVRNIDEVQRTASAGQAAARFDITVYPNPASDLLYIAFPQTEQVTVRLTDITGKTIDEQQVTHKDKAVFDVRALQPGIYLYQVKAGTYTRDGKVLIMR